MAMGMGGSISRATHAHGHTNLTSAYVLKWLRERFPVHGR